MRSLIKNIKTKWRSFWDSINYLIVEMENDWM